MLRAALAARRAAALFALLLPSACATGQPSVELGPGASNFLEVGTRLHWVAGSAPSERLAYWADEVEAWLPLRPFPEG